MRFKEKLLRFFLYVLTELFKCNIQTIKCGECESLNQLTRYTPKTIIATKRYRGTLCVDCRRERFHVEKKLKHNPFKKRCKK